MHNSGKGSSYVRSRGGGEIVYFEEVRTKSLALIREFEIKKLSKIQKEKLILKK